MKKFKAITIAIFISITSFAQHDHSSHKNQLHNTTSDTSNSHLSELLTSYYGIKDALVADNSSQGSVNAERFIKKLKCCWLQGYFWRQCKCATERCYANFYKQRHKKAAGSFPKSSNNRYSIVATILPQVSMALP